MSIFLCFYDVRRIDRPDLRSRLLGHSQVGFLAFYGGIVISEVVTAYRIPLYHYDVGGIDRPDLHSRLPGLSRVGSLACI